MVDDAAELLVRVGAGRVKDTEGADAVFYTKVSINDEVRRTANKKKTVSAGYDTLVLSAY